MAKSEKNGAEKQQKSVSINVSYSSLKLLAVLVIGSFMGYAFAGFGSSGATNQGQQNAPPSDSGGDVAQRVSVSVDDDAVLGNKNAPVTVIEFSDFECPFCGRAFADAVTGIKRDYVDKGKVRFVYRDFPLSFHPMAVPAAEAAECAHEQGKFWEYHDKIFTNQESLSQENLKKWASELGMDSSKFNSCVDSRKFKSEVEKDFSDGSAAGVSGTPTFYIGNDKDGYIQVVGAQPYAVLKQAIEAELAG